MLVHTFSLDVKSLVRDKLKFPRNSNPNKPENIDIIIKNIRVDVKTNKIIYDVEVSKSVGKSPEQVSNETTSSTQTITNEVQFKRSGEYGVH